MVKVPPTQCPRSAPAPPQGAPGGSGRLGTTRGEAGPLCAQPPPQVLELAGSKAAHGPAVDHAGAEFGWPIDREEFDRVELGRKPKGTTGYEEDGNGDEE